MERRREGGALNRPATALRHPALAPAAGQPPERADLSDRARLGVVLQAAGLLSLCEVAGWRLAGDWGAARIDRSGVLTGLAVEPGRAATPPLALLLDLLRRLYGGATIAGRGEARRVARQVAARWSGALDRAAIDPEIAALVAAAPFLAGPSLTAARQGLEGALLRDGQEVSWRAGRPAPAGAPGDPHSLLAARRWHAAARAFLAAPPDDADGRFAQARAFAGDGRLTAALALLGGRADVAAETLRLTCQVHLNELGAARETARRLAARALAPAERLAATDPMLRVLALSGEAEAGRDWCASLVAASRGRARVAARLHAALAAGDRRDLAAMENGLAAAGDAGGEPELEALRCEVALQLALAREDGAAVIEQARRRLRLARRTMTRIEAGRTWNNLGVGRLVERRFAAAERAFAHAARLLRGCDGPLAVTLASTNLAETRLRVGNTSGVEPILAASSAANRRAGNRRGSIEDELIALRHDLVRFDLEGALARGAALAAGLEPEDDREAGRLAVLTARAHGWLERPAAAAAALAGVPHEALRELEPEEVPFLFALAGLAERALAATDGALAPLVAPLVRGELPAGERWALLDPLEPFRRARFVLDAEQVAPGAAPEARRAEAAALLRRLGAPRAADRIERARSVAWRALGEYLEQPPGDREAIERLFAAVGHPEAELRLRDARGERLLAGPGARPLAAERCVVHGEGELVLRAAEFDEPLRALFALLRREIEPPRGGVPAESVGGLIGDSPVLAAAVDRLRRFAAGDLPVLVLGENGTGKELAARLLHDASPRAGGPWVPVNCAGLSETLLLDHLFGHSRGAFTGADRERAGVFETARGGTLFLDEIGDFPPAAQGSLLRALQEGEICRLGETLPRRVDVRVVAATNRDVEAMVEEGKFRRDLLYRLRAATVVLPPLRERGRDVLLLAEHFLDEARRRRPDLRLTAEARAALLAHLWPGNVRELRGALAAAVALCEDGQLAVRHFDLPAARPEVEGDCQGGYHARVEAFRRQLLEEALAESRGNLAAAARRLGVSRQYLSQFVKKYGLDVA